MHKVHVILVLVQKQEMTGDALDSWKPPTQPWTSVCGFVLFDFGLIAPTVHVLNLFTVPSSPGEDGFLLFGPVSVQKHFTWSESSPLANYRKFINRLHPHRFLSVIWRKRSFAVCLKASPATSVNIQRPSDQLLCAGVQFSNYLNIRLSESSQISLIFLICMKGI